MTDYFALLNQPRLPWLDPAELKSTFLTLSSDAHPDRFHSGPQEHRQSANARSAELNAAYQRLHQPKDRLLHLLELELGHKPVEIRTVPADTMELFLQVSEFCRQLDGFLAGRAKASSPIVKAQMFEQALSWTDRIQSLQQVLTSNCTALETRLKAMNSAWERAPTSGTPARASSLPLMELELIYRQLSFLARWNSQLQERLVQLSL